MPVFDLKNTEFQPGLTHIEASAGTGKTWTIEHLLPRFLIDGELEKISEALSVPFCTNNDRKDVERKVSFFTFPFGSSIRKQWIWKIRRDEGTDFETETSLMLFSRSFAHSSRILEVYAHS